MLLSLIVLVQHVQGSIPEIRHLPFEECIKILIERRNAPASVRKLYNDILSYDEAYVIIREIALKMHKNGVRDIPKVDLINYILQILSNIPTMRSFSMKPDDVLSNIQERSYLIIDRGVDEKGQIVSAFSHFSFQKYLTANAFKIACATKGIVEVTENISAVQNTFRTGFGS